MHFHHVAGVEGFKVAWWVPRCGGRGGLHLQDMLTLREVVANSSRNMKTGKAEFTVELLTKCG